MTKSNIANAVVRSMTHADLELVLAWRNHPEVRRYMYTQHEITIEEHQRWFERSRHNQKKHLLIFEINQQPLGFVNFHEAGTFGIADWGFYVAPDAPKGIGQELGCAALNYAFNDVKLHKVAGEALAFNERSIKFHKSLGFQEEGLLRDHHCDGVNYHNVICFGLLSHEWHPKL